MSKMQSFKKDFLDELMERKLDITIDYTEIAIDALMEDGILRDIPVIKSLVSIGKLGVTIRNIYLSKKILCFLKQFHLNEPLSKGSKKILHKIKSDEKFGRRVVDHLIIMIDRYLSEVKAVQLANLFSEYVNGQFDWGTFVYFSVCLDSMHDYDFEILKFLLTNSNEVVEQIPISYLDKYLLLASVERLKTHGFVGSDEHTWESIGDDLKKKVFISSLGTIFANGCFKSTLID